MNVDKQVWTPPAPIVFKYSEKDKAEGYAAYTVGQIHQAFEDGRRATAQQILDDVRYRFFVERLDEHAREIVKIIEGHLKS